MLDKKYQILLTNDDGIESPGLWAAAQALSTIGFVTVAAPRDQVSGTGRSMPVNSDHSIKPVKMNVNNQEWTVYSVGGTPAQVVQHGILEIMPTKPDLVVAGINYGENFGNSITISGTIGAALEGAAMGVPAIAISLQLLNQEHYYNYADLDFSASAFFLLKFAKMFLENQICDDVDILKIEIPALASENTPWRITRLAKHRYYQVEATGRKSWNEGSSLVYHNRISPDQISKDSDIYAVLFDEVVSITPLSLDMTSRVDLINLQSKLQEIDTVNNRNYILKS